MGRVDSHLPSDNRIFLKMKFVHELVLSMIGWTFAAVLAGHAHAQGEVNPQFQVEKTDQKPRPVMDAESSPAWRAAWDWSSTSRPAGSRSVHHAWAGRLLLSHRDPAQRGQPRPRTPTTSGSAGRASSGSKFGLPSRGPDRMGVAGGCVRRSRIRSIPGSEEGVQQGDLVPEMHWLGDLVGVGALPACPRQPGGDRRRALGGPMVAPDGPEPRRSPRSVPVRG